eukprot:UN23888
MHDAHWDFNANGERSIIMFHNGNRDSGSYVLEFKAPEYVDDNGSECVDDNGRCTYKTNSQGYFGPDDYDVLNRLNNEVLTKNEDGGIDKETVRYAEIVGGVERLPNGNLFISAGKWGLFYVINPNNPDEILWQYVNPETGFPPNDS